MQLSKLGLGTYPFSNVFSEVGQDTATELVDLFIASGGNYIETAPLYPVNKIDLGKILSHYPREKIILGSKCAFNKIDGERIISGKASFIREECLKEIERLDCDYIDLIQTHRTPQQGEIDELITTLIALKDEGLIRNIGLSNVSLSQLTMFSQLLPVEWLQVRLSMVHREEYDEIVDFCSLKNIKLNAYQVIERGQLMPQNNARKSNARNDKDVRNSNKEYNGAQDSEIKQWFEQLANRLNAQYGIKPEHLALLWAWQQKCVETCVIGVTKVAQLQSAIAASQLSINDDAMALIEQEYHLLNSHIMDKYQLTLSQFRGAAVWR